MTRTALDKLVFIIGKYNLQQLISAKNTHGGPSVFATKWHTRNECLASEIERMFSRHLAQHAVEINALVCAVKTGCVEQILTTAQRLDSVLLKQFSHKIACAYNLDFNLEQFKQFYSHCFAAAKAAGLHQQLGQCVYTQPLRCRRTPAIPGARKSAATLLFKML